MSDSKSRKLKRAFINDNILIATDGSAKEGRSSFAYCIARKNDGKKLYRSYSPVYVDPEYAFSDRAELLAILAATSHIKMLSKMIQPSMRIQTPIAIYTDSESSITRIEKEKYNSTKHV